MPAPATHATLHVAAMPFPSQQGTQAAIRAMLDVLAGAGRQTHLLTYAHGAYDLDAPFTVHRLADVPPVRSLRSGPSLGKVLLDGQLAVRLRPLYRRVSPDAVVAHHVEAASAAVAASVRPLVFFAHTALEPEFPSYGPRPLRPIARRAGGALDGWLCRRADAVATVSPELQRMVQDTSGAEARYVPIPWPTPEPADDAERRAARERLGLSSEDAVVLYAGNLDAYQDWQALIAALRQLVSRRARAKLLVATESDASPLRALARECGLAERVVTAPLSTEGTRRSVHAAADVAAIPRRSPGGLPIKLLDALARGVPTVAVTRAAAGLDLRGAALLVADDDPDALAAGLDLAIGTPRTAADLGRLGRAYVATDHAPARFVGALDDVVEAARRVYGGQS